MSLHGSSKWSKYLSGALITAAVVSLTACGTQSRRIELSSYAPVIDVKGQGHDLATYQQDLQDCRMLGMVAQAKYDAQREQELEEAKEAAIIGTLAGAILGHAVGSQNDYHTGRAATAGAAYGAAIGGGIGAENVDYDRTLVKFGPTGLVDRCMTDRGYKILSAEGYGGG